MKTVTISSVLCLGLLTGSGVVAGPLSAEDEVPAPAAPQAPEVRDEQILAWVAQLGSDDFRLREEASARLAEVGPRAREALESAVKTSDSLEVRWRAQQLLLRLDGRQEKRMGASEPKRRQPLPGMPGQGAPGQGPQQEEDLRRLLEADTPEEVREMLERLLKGSGGTPGWMSPLAPLEGFDMLGLHVRSGDLTLRRIPFGRERVHLEVRSTDATGIPRVTTFAGADLDAILEAHPELKEHPSLPGLREELERQQDKRRAPMPGMRMPMFSFQSSQGVEIQQDASGVTVRLRERAADGTLTTKELKGATLEEIKRAHPELAEKLGGLHVGFGAPQVFRGPRGERLPPPMPAPAPERAAPGEGEPRFGLQLDALDGLLARHLKLDGRGAVLVRSVLPGSQAEALGLQELDILVAIDAAPVVSLDDALVRLRAAAKAQGALRLDILREGQPRALSR